MGRREVEGDRSEMGRARGRLEKDWGGCPVRIGEEGEKHGKRQAGGRPKGGGGEVVRMGENPGSEQQERRRNGGEGGERVRIKLSKRIKDLNLEGSWKKAQGKAS